MAYLNTMLLIWFSTVTFYLLFLVYASYRQARIANRYIPWAAIAIIGPPVIFGYALDLVWNALIGSIIFIEWPWAESVKPWTWTFTGRCKRWKNDISWRGREARQWAIMLNWADPGHV